MKSILLAPIAMLAAAGDAADADNGTSMFGHSCPVLVNFGSYAMGIDAKIFDWTKNYLASQKSVTKTETKSWGREGEQSICVEVKNRKAARKIYRRIKREIAAKKQLRGPVTVSIN